MTPKDSAVAHLMKNSMMSLLLQETEVRQGFGLSHTGPLHKAERLGERGLGSSGRVFSGSSNLNQALRSCEVGSTGALGVRSVNATRHCDLFFFVFLPVK